jgi:acetylornithine deacetylase/succinyl-diaminopimelate desuccinylase-like protein
MALPAHRPVLDYLHRHQERYLDELREFLRIPSISALSAHQADVRRAAEWLGARLARAGIHDVRVDETKGHPVVFAQSSFTAERPTLLVYGHYDVQPVDPLDQWVSPPFEPTVRDSILYARGASDDKGQLFMHLMALEAWLSTGVPPVNLKFLFEGEEEIGSPHLGQYIREHQAELAADVALISDTPMMGEELPSICYALRGLATMEIRVSGPSQDLHSGVYGGIVMNPAQALAHLIDTLYDASGRIAVPGFYDQVDPLSDRERSELSQLPFDSEAYKAQLGVPELAGEPGYTPLERLWARPTLDVNGLWSGFTGEGQKTIIPATAHAKLSCRLVPHQDPERILDLLEAHLQHHCPPGVQLHVTHRSGSPASVTSLDHPAVKAAESAIELVYQRPAVHIRMGGSIPVVSDFQETLAVPTVLLGFALPDECFHAPNEHFHLANFYRGAQTVAIFWEKLGATHA